MEILELAEMNKADAKNDDNCPFCYKKPHPYVSKQKTETTVVSKPKQLACTPLTVVGGTPYTTARHHLISAKQCYARVKRLVRMASSIGYDINDPPNGISLPTVANNIRYTVGTTVEQKYGKLDADKKKTVAFSVMDASKAQWHVGHHAVEVEILEGWSDEEQNTKWSRGHYVQYDRAVILLLMELTDKWAKEEPCETDDKQKGLKTDLDAKSKFIKDHLDEFKGPEPRLSSPYFVSQLAADYAKERSSEPKPAELAASNESF